MVTERTGHLNANDVSQHTVTTAPITPGSVAAIAGATVPCDSDIDRAAINSMCLALPGGRR